MNADQTRRIIEAIAECDKFIAKEDPRSAALRPKAVQQHLDFCKAHRDKLIGMIAT